MSHKLDIKVGYSCNNHCLFCVQAEKRFEARDKNTADVRLILEKRRPDNDEVVFTGGEVTIRQDFFELLSFARQLGYKIIQVQSNGRMFAYEDFCKKAVDSGANNFALALHGSKSNIHDSLTCAAGSFEQTVRGIKNLRKLKQNILLNTVITKINYQDLPDIAKLLVSLKVDQFQFAFIHISSIVKGDRRLAEKIIPRKTQVKEYVKKGLQIGIDNNILVMAEAFPYCFMDGYEKYNSEKFIPPTSIEEEIFIEDFDKTRKEQGKIKGAICAGCKYNCTCEGPWKEYPQIFGWKEFKPVRK